MHNMVKIAQNGSKWPKLPKMTNIVQNGLTWPKMAKNCSKWPKIAHIAQNG
jgi:hypothetical protein